MAKGELINQTISPGQYIMTHIIGNICSTQRDTKHQFKINQQVAWTNTDGTVGRLAKL